MKDRGFESNPLVVIIPWIIHPICSLILQTPTRCQEGEPGRLPRLSTILEAT